MEDIDQSTEDTLFFRQNKSSSADDSDKETIKDESVPSSAKKQSPSSKNQGGEGNDDDEKIVPLATFRTWKKLPKRLNVWVFQFNPINPTDLSLSKGGGFPRPDLLPMADIFRSFDDC